MIMMNHPDFDEVFYFQTDVSNVALGAELYQEDDEGEHLTLSLIHISIIIVSKREFQKQKSAWVY